ncbi:unnamed protein product, partial [Iphiclides podalirius]
MSSRSRLLYIAPRSPVPGIVSLSHERWGHMHCASGHRSRRGTSARTGQRRHTTTPVAMAKRPGTRARPAPQPPEPARARPSSPERGEQTRHASPSNTVTRLKRILDFHRAFHGSIVRDAELSEPRPRRGRGAVEPDLGR